MNLLSGKILIFGVLLITVGLFYFFKPSNSNQAQPVREHNPEYKFINPLLFYEGPSDIEGHKILVTSLEEEINKFKNVKASVYYRDLTQGKWVDLGSNNTYSPASLLKVVVLIAYLKQAESDPQVLSKPIRYTEEIHAVLDTVPQNHGTTLVLNNSYSVNELINKMIIESDNGATYALLSQINEKVLDNVYEGLGIENPENQGRTYTISPHDYAYFFRILYNATYLNRNMSERALSILAKTSFRDGLAANIPATMPVAHKYGESITDSSVELHDCGIVYHPEKPYMLCIMTRGKNIDELKNIIGVISNTVFKYVETK